MGQQIFDANGDFTVPSGITTINVCMCGGGGSGASDDSEAGGGFAGEIYSGPLTVVGGAIHAVTVGVGGASVDDDGREGNVGTASSIGALKTVAGGTGGGAFGSGGPRSYLGNGASRTTCGGTYADGIAFLSEFGFEAYGGQAGAFGNGGFGWNFDPAGPGGVGAGGGGVSESKGGGEPSGPGGNGRVVINWDDFVEDGGLLMNGTSIPELIGTGAVNIQATDQLAAPFDGNVTALVIDGTEVWRETL